MSAVVIALALAAAIVAVCAVKWTLEKPRRDFFRNKGRK
jgi:hypothetical protein